VNSDGALHDATPPIEIHGEERGGGRNDVHQQGTTPLREQTNDHLQESNEYSTTHSTRKQAINRSNKGKMVRVSR